MLGTEPTQLALAVGDLALELVDQTQAGLDRCLPRLGQTEPGEQLATTETEEIGDRAGSAVREQDGVHALLQTRAVADKVQPPAGSFALGAHARVGQPDRRHQVAAGELGQYPGVDPVGLAGERRESFYFLRVGDLDLPTGQLEPVVHEAGAVHRLDRRADRRAVTLEPLRQAAQPICVRRRRANLDGRALTVKQVEVETLRLRSKPAYNIETGLLCDSSQ